MSAHVSVCLSARLSARLSMCSSIYPFCLPLHVCKYLSVYVSIYLIYASKRGYHRPFLSEYLIKPNPITQYLIVYRNVTIARSLLHESVCLKPFCQAFVLGNLLNQASHQATNKPSRQPTKQPTQALDVKAPIVVVLVALSRRCLAWQHRQCQGLRVLAAGALEGHVARAFVGVALAVHGIVVGLTSADGHL